MTDVKSDTPVPNDVEMMADPIVARKNVRRRRFFHLLAAFVGGMLLFHVAHKTTGSVDISQLFSPKHLEEPVPAQLPDVHNDGELPAPPPYDDSHNDSPDDSHDDSHEDIHDDHDEHPGKHHGGHRGKHHGGHGQKPHGRKRPMCHDDEEKEFTIEELRSAVLETVQPESIRAWAEHYFLSGPHLAGQNKKLAKWTRDKFLEFGFPKAHIETFDIWVNYPAEHRVALIDPKDDSVVEELSLEEDVLDEDPTTGDKRRIPTFHGYSASGNFTGKLVYANYGRKEDYDKLVAEGVDLKDKVVLVRYGGLFRGLKVRLAEELGAGAVLIYSDPGDDHGITEENGYKAYPDGPARNPSSVQRGSVQDLSHAPGDPTTPGYPSTPDADRTPPQGIPGIPSIPISYRDALPLLKALNGHGPKAFNDDWVGGLKKASYDIGPSKLEVNVYNLQDYDFRPNHDVIAKLPGKIDEEIIIGNHRDAWILGGADPNSGSASVLELARVLGNLYSQGWRPYRTIKFASWDGEEYGLLGSTEWGEKHASHLGKHAYAYLNSDVSFSGSRFGVSANPLLSSAIYEAAAFVPSPFNKHKSLYDDWNSTSTHEIPYISPLGSGSDYTVFQDFLGIPSLDFGYGEGPEDPIYHYHSNYDSFHWMTTYGDKDFHGHAAASKFIGLVAIALAQPPIVPFTTTAYATFIDDTLSSLLSGLNEDDELVNSVLESASLFVQKAEDFDTAATAVHDALQGEFKWYQKWRKLILLHTASVLNKRLQYLDRVFLHDDGLDERPWFKHIVFSPGRWTGYAGQVFPGIAESLEDRDFDRLAKWLEITRDALTNASSALH